MGQPRPGRRKAVVLSSDEEDESVAVEDILSDSDDQSRKSDIVQAQPKGSSRTRGATRKATTAESTISKAASKTTPAATQSQQPAKGMAKPATVPEAKRANKSIYSFFNAATQRQQSQPSASPEKPRASQETVQEDILDDISGDDTAVPFSKGSHIALAVRKRKLHHDQFEAGADDDVPPATQKFRKVSDGSKVSVKATVAVENQRPWTECFPPLDLSELAVHKKKVQDVRNVLESGLSSRAVPRLIVLKGPAGCAKTTTVNLLAKDMGAQILEWKNPARSDTSSEPSVSASAQFEEFIFRSGQYAGLQLATSDGTSTAPDYQSPKDNAPQIMVVEEFPNTFARSSTALQSFRSTIQQFLATPRSSIAKPTPLVMVISEALLSTTTASADSFTAHRLLGPQILSHPQTAELEFNPVAMTFLTKALDLIVVKEARKSGRRKTPGPQVLKHIAETGDIRGAVSSLEFLCLRGDEGDMWSAKVTFTKSKGGKKDVSLTKQEQEALKLISNRESSLGIFHAVGKVVYNKRQDPEQPVPQPPNHLPQHRKPKVPEADVDALINELGTDTSTFIAALHENYALSCNSTSTEDALDSLNGCIDALSDSDLLSLDRFGFGTRAYSGSAQDNLRQDDMSFQCAVRGLLFALPSPVHRGDVGGGKRGDAFKMFYPASLKIWKRREEIEGTLDLVVQSLQREFGASGTFRSGTGKKEGVENWRRSTTLDSPAQENTGSEEDLSLLAAISSSAKTEMLLDRLPYTSQILSRRKGASPSFLANLTQLTSLHGEAVAAAGLEDAGDYDVQHRTGSNDWTTDRPDSDNDLHSRRKDNKKEKEGGGLNIPVEHAVEKLVLSDDDIEDD